MGDVVSAEQEAPAAQAGRRAPAGLQIPERSGRERGRAPPQGGGYEREPVGVGCCQRLLGPLAQESELECCMDAVETNTTCLAENQCSPGCYRRWNEDGSSSCIKCDNETVAATPAYNLTDCRNSSLVDGGRGMNSQMNLTTVTPVTLGVGSPEVAASLIFGTFVISLFLILCVASFFYLKRANKLPNLFYRRSKGSVVQSAESASMLSPPSSVRKPRYVRRERSLMTSGTSTTISAETRVSNV
uniref:uncharacterized protein C1orf159 homolog isoform X3 n=1 Tax=Podarcis muralis TaxID=64176 RepID=UPI00109FBB45|nr:uncharacterized protein C1orf159 homolog isoform X3 [Podarcis muralis]